MAQERPTFRNYDDFFAFYMTQHADPGNRVLHTVGTIAGAAIMVGAFALHHPWYALLWVPVGYGCAWVGHFLLEKNTPATFGHPLWSFISDFRMVGLLLTGRIGPWLKKKSPES